MFGRRVSDERRHRRRGRVAARRQCLLRSPRLARHRVPGDRRARARSAGDDSFEHLVIVAAVFDDTTRVSGRRRGVVVLAVRVDRRVEQARRAGHAAVRDRRERVEHLHAGDRDAVADRGRRTCRSRSTATAGSAGRSADRATQWRSCSRARRRAARRRCLDRACAARSRSFRRSTTRGGCRPSSSARCHRARPCAARRRSTASLAGSTRMEYGTANSVSGATRPCSSAHEIVIELVRRPRLEQLGERRVVVARSGNLCRRRRRRTRDTGHREHVARVDVDARPPCRRWRPSLAPGRAASTRPPTACLRRSSARCRCRAARQPASVAVLGMS